MTIELNFDGHFIKNGYERVPGTVKALVRADGRSVDDALIKLRKRAAEVGANYVLGCHMAGSGGFWAVNGEAITIERIPA